MIFASSHTFFDLFGHRIARPPRSFLQHHKLIKPSRQLLHGVFLLHIALNLCGYVRTRVRFANLPEARVGSRGPSHPSPHALTHGA